MVHGWHAIVEHIDSSQIHLWLAYLDEITDPRLLAEYQLLLSREELQKQRRFYFEADRHRYLVSRAMMRTVLSRYAKVAPRDWMFVVNAYGRPSISPRQAKAARIQFNISHTRRVVLLGIAVGRSLGVDIEDMSGNNTCVDVAERFFAPEEVRALRALAPERRARRFLEYWTLKESYIKARGLGLSIPLDLFAFHLDNAGRIRFTVDTALADPPTRWMFWQMQLPHEHLAAVCVEQAAGGQLHLLPARCWN